MIKIFIVDDHTLIHEGIKKTLSNESDMKIVGSAHNAVELFASTSLSEADLLILDLMMPGRGGLEVLKDLEKRYPDLRLLVLSLYPEQSMASRAFKAGADGYVTKEAAPEELVKAIRKVAGGGRYVSQQFAETLVDDLKKGGKAPHELLSDREYQVLCMIAAGKAVSEIAHELSLGVATIHTYRARILEKMEMKTNAELIHYAIRNRLVE